MRALRLHGPRDLRIHEEPVPRPSAGEAQIKIMAVGICASDLHYYRDGRIGSTILTSPLVIGHEASGLVTDVGEGVTNVRPGDRVAIEPAKPCMDCEYCRSGHYNVCPGIPFFGTPPTDGCLRDYITWPGSLLLPVPDFLSFDEAAMVEPLAIGVYAVELASVDVGDTIAILGAGAIGLSVLQAVRAAGVDRIVVFEPVEERRKLAKRLGASETVDPSQCRYENIIRQYTNGRGADVVFECTGEEDAVRQSCKIAAVLGKVMVVGIPDGDDYAFDASTARRKQLSAVFVRRSNLTTEKAIEWTAEGKADVACFATHHFPLEETARAMDLAASRKDGVIRAIVQLADTTMQ